MDKTFERIYWCFEKLENVGKDRILQQLDVIVNVGKLGFESLFAYGKGYESFYESCIDSIIVERKELLIFLSEIKKISEDSYIYLTGGHDILNINEYFKFKNLDSSTKYDKYKDFMDFSVYFRYSLKRILNESDEEKRKCMLKAMLGM